MYMQPHPAVAPSRTLVEAYDQCLEILDAGAAIPSGCPKYFQSLIDELLALEFSIGAVDLKRQSPKDNHAALALRHDGIIAAEPLATTLYLVGVVNRLPMTLYETECEHRRCIAIEGVTDHTLNDDAKEIMRCTMTRMMDTANSPPVIMTENVTYQMRECGFAESATLIIKEAINHLNDQVGGDRRAIRELIKTNTHLPKVLFDHLQSELLSLKKIITGTEDWDESKMPRHHILDSTCGTIN